MVSSLDGKGHEEMWLWVKTCQNMLDTFWGSFPLFKGFLGVQGGSTHSHVRTVVDMLKFPDIRQGASIVS